MQQAEKRRFKDDLFEQFARIGKALSSGRRLELVDLLAQGPYTVEELAQLTGMSVANTSQHLQVLRRARLVDTRQEGTYVHYRLADETVFRLWQTLRGVGERRLSEVDWIVRDYLKDRHRLEPVKAGDLLDRMREGHVVVLDVRPGKEFKAGHIKGARSVPLDELEARLEDVSRDVEVVAYCRGPYCVFADEAVDRLRQLGYRARRLDVGFPDWRAAGLPVEAEEASGS